MIKIELLPIHDPHSFSFPAFSIVINFANFIVSVLILLIFASIIPYASEPVWTETIIFSVIFLLMSFCILKIQTPLEIKQLLIPVFLIAFYSIFQGLTTLLFDKNYFQSFDASASLRSGLKIAAFAGFIWLLIIFFQSKIKLLVWSLIFTGNFFAVFGILRFLLQHYFPSVYPEFIFPQLPFDKGFGTYLNQNHFAYLMLMTLGLNISFFRDANFKNLNWLIWLGLSLTSWAALILTGSRGGIISSFVEISVLILLPLILNKNSQTNISRPFQNLLKPFSIIAGIFILFIFGLIFIGQERVLHRFGELPLQVEGMTSWATFRRIDVWQAAFGILRDYWFSGIGFGGFRVAVSQYINISGQLAPEQAHNDYLEFATAAGIIGIIFAVWFLYKFFRLTRQRFNEKTTPFSNTIRIGAVCGIAGITLHSLVDFGLQIEANLLFFAALFFLVIHRSDKENETSKAKNIQPFLPKIICAILLVSAAFYSAILGFADYKLQQAKTNFNTETLENPLLKFAFNADIYSVKADIDEKNGKDFSALKNLDTAISYRPDDYELHLEKAQILQLQNETEAAEKSFQRALELAPNYAKPYFFYGQFLVATNRTIEGFDALRKSFQRNPKYFDAAAELAWKESKENPLKTIEILSPLAPVEREYLAAVFFQKGEFKGFLNLTCREEDVAPKMREKIVQTFFEIKEFHFADLIDKRDCNAENFPSRDFTDGDFEIGKLNKKAGFGWHIGGLPANVKIYFDTESFSSGRQSLGVNFDGDYENDPIFSQTIVVEKNSKYLLTFSYRTDELKTVGFPVMQIVGENSRQGDLIKTVALAPQEKNWTRISTEIRTDDRFEALEIRLARNRCEQHLCSIFGNLWLDDFHLQKKIKENH